jgi:hypothetical protein
MKDFKLADGRDQLVRHSHGRERMIQTGIGAIEVQQVKIRDRALRPDGERIRFNSPLLPPARFMDISEANQRVKTRMPCN